MSLTMETATVQAVLNGTVVGGNGYGISHQWDGSVLTIRSDSGTSSADLLGPQGPKGDGAEQLLVTITEKGSTYTADKTFAELSAAVAEGVQPSARLVGANGESYGQLAAFAEGRSIQFGSWLHGGVLDASTVITIAVDDSVTVSYPAQLKAKNVSAVKADSTITVTVSYEDLSKSETVITLDDSGNPVSVTTDGVSCALSWEGFDE